MTYHKSTSSTSDFPLRRLAAQNHTHINIYVCGVARRRRAVGNTRSFVQSCGQTHLLRLVQSTHTRIRNEDCSYLEMFVLY